MFSEGLPVAAYSIESLGEIPKEIRILDQPNEARINCWELVGSTAITERVYTRLGSLFGNCLFQYDFQRPNLSASYLGSPEEK